MIAYPVMRDHLKVSALNTKATKFDKSEYAFSVDRSLPTLGIDQTLLPPIHGGFHGEMRSCYRHIDDLEPKVIESGLGGLGNICHQNVKVY